METPLRARESLNIEEEYNNTLRMQSEACLLSKEEQSVEEMEVQVLLHTQEDLIAPMLQKLLMHQRTASEIELAMADYFDASAEGSEVCRELLRNIRCTQSNYQSMDTFLASMSDGTAAAASTSAIGDDEPAMRGNPFRTTTRSDFAQVHDKYSSILESIRSSHGKVARKLRVVRAVKRLSRSLLVAACGVAAAASIGAAVHLLFLGLVVVPAAAAVERKRRLTATEAAARPAAGRTTTASLLRLRDQLNTAAKGMYVLGRDLDTLSQLVARLSDGIEWENAMARRCAERAGERCSVAEMVSELRRSCSNSRKLADELEQHVWLCLATIRRVRLLVIQEITTPKQRTREDVGCGDLLSEADGMACQWRGGEDNKEAQYY